MPSPGRGQWVNTTISTRRFLALAEAVVPASLGLASPKPSELTRLASTPLLTRYCRTASARACDNSWLLPHLLCRLGSLSVWPCPLIGLPPYFCLSATATLFRLV